MFRKNNFLFAFSILVIVFPLLGNEPTVIEITQSPCKFDQLEKDTSKYTTSKSQDCELINQTSIKLRKNKFKTLKLTSGHYIFRVTNDGIPYEVGFYLRGTGLSWLTLPSVSGGDLMNGQTKEYKLYLEPGKYKISCPLNPTPDYDLIVEK
ncbi:hypothetical protein [Leptospira sp. GIMC2001]|uniref:hypothetical protein n=1 Tax=Leptospira sp. GIMC2001 TaxID=1513297 RepID=UPI00234AFEDD|nr:hypothetical protein [Leptospira sp. GIMC2001]WCL47587.1 hypothetical protein O4O04_01065 [Leptospira sp. GIMC2001]